MSIARVAEEHGRCRTWLAKLAALSCIAPDIITAIVEGRQPPSLDACALLAADLPLDWHGRCVTLGFEQARYSHCSLKTWYQRLDAFLRASFLVLTVSRLQLLFHAQGSAQYYGVPGGKSAKPINVWDTLDCLVRHAVQREPVSAEIPDFTGIYREFLHFGAKD